MYPTDGNKIFSKMAVKDFLTLLEFPLLRHGCCICTSSDVVYAVRCSASYTQMKAHLVAVNMKGEQDI